MGLLDFFKPNIDNLKAENNIQDLIKALFFRRDEHIRMKAAKALGDLRDKTAVEPLMVALKDKSPNIRYFAAESLGRIGDPRAVDELIEALKDDKFPECLGIHNIIIKVRDSAALALGKIGDCSACNPIFNDYKGLFKEHVLARLGDKRAIDLICNKRYVNYDLAEKILECGKGNIDFLIYALKSNKENLRSVAAKILKDSDYSPSNLNDKIFFYIVSRNNVGILTIGESAISYLVYLINNKIEEYECIKMISQIGGPLAEKELEKLLSIWNLNNNVNKALINLYKKQGDAEKLLTILRKEPDVEIKQKALAAMLDIKDPKLLPILIDLLDTDLREFAAEMLGEMGDSRAIEPLIKLVKKSFSRHSLIALAKMGDERAAETLIDKIFLYFNKFWIIKDSRTHHSDELRSAIKNSPWLGKYGPILAKITAVKEKKYFEKEGEAVITEYDTREVLNGISELASINTPISNNILHKILTMKDPYVDIRRVTGYEISPTMPLSFEAERSHAEMILTSRCSPPYDPKAYLNKEEWSI